MSGVQFLAGLVEVPAFCPMQPSVCAVSIRRDKPRITVRGPPLLIVGCLISTENQGVIRNLMHAKIVPPVRKAHREEGLTNCKFRD